MGRPRLAPHQKKARRLNAHLVFLDETGFLMLPTLRRTWGLRGKTPYLRHRLSHWSKVSAIGAVTVSPRRRRLGLYLHLWPDANVSQEAVILFLRSLRRQLRRPVVLVWDRWSVHRGREVRAYLARQRWLHVEWLPPYAPDLNPMDKGWAHVKGHDLANHGLEDLDALTDAVIEDYRTVRRQQRLLRSFVRATGLPIRL
ncbi:MAG: transposase [Planctomycetota bacterium]|nr:transposase [Planctomycetota bacterium]